MNKGPTLPQLQQQVLDEATLEQYQADLNQLGDILEVKVRSATARMEPQPAGLIADALQALRVANARGVQIRYRYCGRHWLDTLLPSAAGVCLTRICLDDV